MEFDGTGKQLDYEIFPSIIKSRKQMTYKKVNEILEEDDNRVVFTPHYRRFMQLVEYLVMCHADKDIYSSYKGKISAYKSNFRYEVFDFGSNSE